MATQATQPERTETQTVLLEMFQENTGKHLLDSGGAYGRNWERNQKKDLFEEPMIDAQYGDVTVSAIRWLEDRVTFDPDMDAKYQAFVSERADTGHLDDMMSFAESLEGTGLYGDGDPMTVNTYNHECVLSQTLQFVYFEHDHTSYVILQVHGGCDVRGGYTAPRVFETDEMIFYFSQVDARCVECEATWDPSHGTEFRGYQCEDFSLDGDGVEVDEEGSIACPCEDCDGRVYFHPC